jgi:hypothetical protein
MPVRPSFAPPRKQSTVGWLMLLNRPYIRFTSDLLPTNANRNEEANRMDSNTYLTPARATTSLMRLMINQTSMILLMTKNFKRLRTIPTQMMKQTMKPIMKMNTIQTVMTGCWTILTMQQLHPAPNTKRATMMAPIMYIPKHLLCFLPPPPYETT